MLWDFCIVPFFNSWEVWTILKRGYNFMFYQLQVELGS